MSQPSAYQSYEKFGTNASQNEAKALLEAARMLDACLSKPDDIDSYKAALRLNWRLWTIFQADISSEENPLPQNIKQNVLSLSVFIDKHTVNALAEPDTQKLNVLIDINKNIASGLLTKPDADDNDLSVSGDETSAGPPTNLRSEEIVA